MTRPRSVLLVCLLSAACQSPRVDPRPPMLFEGLGDHRCEVTCRDAEARRWFDQGLALCYGFNHDEAANSFEQAVRIAPDFAMGYWGIAYALSPNYNLWDEGEQYSSRASAALRRARELAPQVSERERELILALSQRFAEPRPAARDALNAAYADAMREVWRKYPTDADVGCLFADALLNKHPWDQWEVDGRPKWETVEIQATLERVLELDVNHPGANHLYIHTMEASHTPERAEAAADRLGALMPGAGHMVHMPAHIYMRVGRYADAERINVAAARLDRAYFAATGTEQSTGIYHLYHAHNHHFMIWAAMFEGRCEDALAQCDQLLADIPQAMIDHQFFADWHATRFHVWLRFGRWQEILDAKAPASTDPYPQAIWHYARGIALANTDRCAEARTEAALFETEAAKVRETDYIHVVPARAVLEVARNMLAGETAFKEGRKAAAFASLRAAVAAETALRYTEPNPWMMPARHALGALLLQEGEVAEAEQCYRDDLARYPQNGWSLHGLAECLQRAGKPEAAAVQAQFDKAWAKATVPIAASCFCRGQ